MKQVSATVTQLPIGQTKPMSQQSESDQFAARVINRIFEELQAIFTAWRSAMPNDKAVALAKRNYVKAMMAKNVSTPEMVSRGLAKARECENDFFPSPGKFVAWCLDDGEWREAFSRLTRHQKPLNTLERLVRNEVGYEMRFLNAEKAETRFRIAFEKWKAKERRGELPEELIALPARSSVSVTDKARNAHGIADPQKMPGRFSRLIAQRVATKQTRG